jgi:hypothetical protein
MKVAIYNNINAKNLIRRLKNSTLTYGTGTSERVQYLQRYL